MRIKNTNIIKKTAVLALFMSQAMTANALNKTVSSGGNIQTAIDQVAAGGGGTVTVNSGTYTLSSELKMKHKVVLNGKGDSTVIRGSGTSYTHKLINTADSSAQYRNVGIRSIRLDGRNGGERGECVRLTSNSNTYAIMQLGNLYVHNYDGHGMNGGGVNKLSIYNNRVKDCGNISLWHNTYFLRLTNSVVKDCWWYRSPKGDGFKLSVFDNVKIERNEAYDNNYNGFTTNQDSNNQNVNLLDNEFRNNTGGGIYVYCNSGSVQDNWLKNNQGRVGLFMNQKGSNLGSPYYKNNLVQGHEINYSEHGGWRNLGGNN